MIRPGPANTGGLVVSTLAALLVVSAAGAGAMALWRRADVEADRREMERLLALQPSAPPVFDPAMVDELPEPARRYFAWSIAAGTPLRTVVRLRMEGTFRMGNASRFTDFAMTGSQVLAGGEGFLWAMTARRGNMVLSGSDSGRWSRFWVLGLVPVARAGGTEDFARSAFARGVAEAVIWAPASLLPDKGVSWEVLDEDRARVTVVHHGQEQAVDIRLGPDGRPLEISLQRWSDANPERRFRLQPFGGRLSDFRRVDGFRVAHRVEGGNFFGTDDYFPFYDVEVTDIAWPDP